MKKTNKKYSQFKIRLLPSHNIKIEELQDNINSEYEITIFKNDIVRIAISEFLESNPDVNKFKETLKKHDYI